ncbi:hypothetical protein F8154_09270 [Alkaliphilus pronyensis]|uniref:Uncharacterized protein n=1 Tax=Alkaliphilus pronyensis TaxID=1482732 RepID=A0A6I0F7G2_9FIRM|nr:hypothetical protein [Alkaliphilus pronyensis]KAB3534117.1 hypothetical protein F8154_09270 [Alkaliphilus pronyensis]
MRHKLVEGDALLVTVIQGEKDSAELQTIFIAQTIHHKIMDMPEELWIKAYEEILKEIKSTI